MKPVKKHPHKHRSRWVRWLVFPTACFCWFVGLSSLADDHTSAQHQAGILTGEPRPDPALVDRLAQTMAATYDHTDRFDAEVWLHASNQRLTRYLDDSEQRLDLLQLVYREAHQQGLDPDLVLAVMQVESAFDRFAVSHAGAQGLMQVMPFWRLEIGRPQDNLIDAPTNVRYGTTILAHYLDVARGDLVDALARYNGSRGRLKYPELVVSAWRKNWRTRSSDELPGLLKGCANHALRACRYR